MNQPPFVKICGNRTASDVAVAAQLGADFIGIVFAESARKVGIPEARAMVRQLGPSLDSFELESPPPNHSDTELVTDLGLWYKYGADKIESYLGYKRPLAVGVFADQSAEEINNIVEETGIDLVQLSGSEPWNFSLTVNRQVVQVIHIDPEDDLSDPLVDVPVGRSLALMLDAKSSKYAGGTGKQISIDLAKNAAKKIPLILAGGLTPENVRAVVRAVKPWAVDVSSGTETDGLKDYKKVASFIENAKSN
jgi:anthranilate synthase/indole-3-glycerol phosphate synthase/phosphoribosylanthranilate isomerase|tara:strand:- start:350 stop:1099 length:750 start_codon:yes stop_codon:yes gene_type:complete